MLERLLGVDANESLGGTHGVFLLALFSTTLLRALLRVILLLLWLCINDHGSMVVFRSVSVRPKHHFDLNFDHDDFFELPLQGAGCPTKFTVFTSHHVRYRAVPRTNRTPATANTCNRFATSSTNALP